MVCSAAGRAKNAGDDDRRDTAKAEANKTVLYQHAIQATSDEDLRVSSLRDTFACVHVRHTSTMSRLSMRHRKRMVELNPSSLST